MIDNEVYSQVEDASNINLEYIYGITFRPKSNPYIYENHCSSSPFNYNRMSFNITEDYISSSLLIDQY